MFTALLIIVGLLLFWPMIARFIGRMTRRFMAHRAEDFLRRSMGMPSRKEERRRRRREAKQEGGKQSARSTQSRPASSAHPSELMRGVATDVEFTEIREFSSTTVAEERDGNVKIVQEDQVSDAEFVEIKTPTHKKC